MVQIIKGSFDAELAKNFADLIDKVNDGEIDLERDGGGESIVVFIGEYTIKHPYIGSKHKDNSNLAKLTHEYEIGKELKEIGVNVPEMHAVCVRDEFPFLIMSTLNVCSIDELTKEQRKDARKQYREQLKLARERGFIGGDIDRATTNYGYNAKTRKGYFYDFTDWRRE